MTPHINMFNVVWILYHELSAKLMKLINFTEAEVNVKNKIIDILNQHVSICECLILKRKTH